MQRRAWFRAGAIAGILAAVLAAFSWGFLVGRNRLPPYDRIVAVLRSAREGHSVLAALYGRAVDTRKRKPVGKLFGRYAPARDLAGQQPPPEGSTELEALQTLGYVDAAEPAPAASGVVTWDRARADSAPLLYTSGDAPAAYLIDRDGTVLHTWSRTFEEAFPGALAPRDRASFHSFRKAVLLDDGSLLAIFEGRGIMKLDRDSNIVWARKNCSHHDLQVADSGEIWVLTREAHVRPDCDPTRPVLEDFITVLSPDGDEIRRVSLLDAVLKSRFKPLMAYAPAAGDLMHTNTIELLDGRLADRSSAFRAGNVLVSFNRFNAIGVVDPDRDRLVWAIAGQSDGNHYPTLLDNGDLLIFDNRGSDGYSRVIEVDPFSQELKWGYYGDEKNDFQSWYCGASHRLPNGNTLITETSRGRAFEVTPDDGIVWDFYSPHRGGENGELIALLFEMQRVDPERLGWLR